MRKTGYMFWQTLLSIIYYKKRYVLYLISFYAGLLLPALCIANYSHIRNMFHYYVFDGMEQSVSLDWQSYSFDTAKQDIPAEYTVSAQCQEIFLNWNSIPLSVKGIGKNYYYNLSGVEGRMFTDAEMDYGKYVCILDKKTSLTYDCRLNDTITIKGITFTVIGISTDPLFMNQIIIPFSAMEKIYRAHDTYIQFTGIYMLGRDRDQEQFLAEIENAVYEKDKDARILFSDTGEQMFENAVQSVEKWKLLRGMTALGASLFFILNEVVIIIGKMQKERKTIGIKMALGASRYTVAFSCLLEISFITLIADALIFLTIRPIAKAFALEDILLFNPFVIVISAIISIGAAVMITLAVLWNLRKNTISSLMKSEEA